MTNGDFKLYFGKYKGKTLDEVYAIDKKYLKWIHKEFKPGSVLTAVDNFLNLDPNLEIDFKGDDMSMDNPLAEPEEENDDEMEEEKPYYDREVWNENDIPF